MTPEVEAYDDSALHSEIGLLEKPYLHFLPTLKKPEDQVLQGSTQSVSPESFAAA